ncbi:MAG: hypothetical protein A2Y78_08940 [Acidobacteria bacterium RBG_13_68_16]|nr:MAG: hypothetical protein A2Y78_08940 [Acidobacteria bacterium RBG_13_68_16]
MRCWAAALMLPLAGCVYAPDRIVTVISVTAAPGATVTIVVDPSIAPDTVLKGSLRARLVPPFGPVE